MDAQVVKAPAGMATRASSGVIGRVGGWIALWRAYRQARQERAQLLAMSDRDLHDIGLSRIDAIQAAQHLFRRNR